MLWLQLGIRDLLQQYSVPHHFTYFSLDAEGQVSTRQNHLLCGMAGV
jgi:hypothetical protein